MIKFQHNWPIYQADYIKAEDTPKNPRKCQGVSAEDVGVMCEYVFSKVFLLIFF